MRDSCVECGIKHLGQAIVNMHEVVKGYPYHFVYVIGHLAECEDELAKNYPELKDKVYSLRKQYMKGSEICIEPLVEELYSIWKALE